MTEQLNDETTIRQIIKVHPEDNVCVAIIPLTKSTQFCIDGHSIDIVQILCVDCCLLSPWCCQDTQQQQ